MSYSIQDVTSVPHIFIPHTFISNFDQRFLCRVQRFQNFNIILIELYYTSVYIKSLEALCNPGDYHLPGNIGRVEGE